MTKIIDVVVPCYNVESTINNCFDSLCNQSLPRDNYHCFFVNDCSTDETGIILDKHRKEDNITLIHHENNQGLAATRNTGIKAGTSKYVAFLDGDMVIKKNWLESFLAYLNDNVVAVMGDNIPPNNISLSPVVKYYFGKLRGARKFKNVENIPLEYMLFGNAFVKREVLEKCGIFDESFKKYGGEDTDLAARIWDVYPNSFVFSKNSNAVHFHRRTLDEFCNSMKTYGIHNLPLLIKKHPRHKKKFASDWIFTLKGKLVFNRIVRHLINFIFKIYPFQILIRYLIADSVISGARLSKRFNYF